MQEVGAVPGTAVYIWNLIAISRSSSISNVTEKNNEQNRLLLVLCVSAWPLMYNASRQLGNTNCYSLLTRFSSGPQGLPEPLAVLPKPISMCTPWKTNLSQARERRSMKLHFFWFVKQNRKSTPAWQLSSVHGLICGQPGGIFPSIADKGH